MQRQVKIGVGATDSASKTHQDNFHKTFCQRSKSHLKQKNFDRHTQGDYCTLSRLSVEIQRTKLQER